MTGTLLRRAFGGKPPVIGKFDPSKAKAEEGDDQEKDDDTASDEEDDLAEGDSGDDDSAKKNKSEDESDDDESAKKKSEDVPEDDEDDDDGEAIASVASERNDWVAVMSSMDLPPGAAAAVEALGTGQGTTAAFQAALSAGGGSSDLARLAQRRGKHPKAPNASGGGSKKSGTSAYEDGKKIGAMLSRRKRG